VLVLLVCQVLRPVRAIAAMYRVPSRPPPTRHSHYVPGILQPLKVRRPPIPWRRRAAPNTYPALYFSLQNTSWYPSVNDARALAQAHLLVPAMHRNRLSCPSLGECSIAWVCVWAQAGCLACWVCLQAALAEGSGEAQALLSAEMRGQVVRLVLEKTTGRFQELAKELVATVRGEALLACSA